MGTCACEGGEESGVAARVPSPSSRTHRLRLRDLGIVHAHDALQKGGRLHSVAEHYHAAAVFPGPDLGVVHAIDLRRKRAVLGPECSTLGGCMLMVHDAGSS